MGTVALDVPQFDYKFHGKLAWAYNMIGSALHGIVKKAVVKKISAVLTNMTDHVLPAVPIQVAAPPADLDRYNVKIAAGNEFLRDVTLRGLPQDIRRIIDGEVRVAAFVHLTSDDLVQNVKERPISMWMLPDGVSVIRIGNGDTISPRIPLEITDRPAG